MNYMFIIEGLSNEAARKTQLANTIPATFELNKNEQGSLLDEIFDENKEESVVGQVNKYFETDESRTPFYIYSSNNIMSKYFNRYGMTLNVKKTAEVDLIDTVTDKKYHISSNIETCVNDVFGKKYVLRLREGYIYKINTDEKLPINSGNLIEVEDFLKDVCGISKLSKMFKQDSQPSFALFYVNSVAKLEQKLSKQDFNFILDVFKMTMKKASNNFALKFKEKNVLGQVLFIDHEETSYLIANEKTGAMTPKVVLAQMEGKPQKVSNRRRLATETMGDSVFDQDTY